MAKEAVISSIRDDLVPYDELKVRELFGLSEADLEAVCAEGGPKAAPRYSDEF